MTHELRIHTQPLLHGRCQYDSTFPVTLGKHDMISSEDKIFPSNFMFHIICLQLSTDTMDEACYVCRLQSYPNMESSSTNRMRQSSDVSPNIIMRWSTAVRIISKLPSNKTTLKEILRNRFIQRDIVISSSVCYHSLFNIKYETKDLSSAYMPSIPPKGEPMEESFVMSFSHPPTIPLSVVFRLKTRTLQHEASRSMHSLFMLRLKRKLTGYCLMFGHDGTITSEITITVENALLCLVLEAVCCSQSSKVS
jgi:hypothetical protein